MSRRTLLCRLPAAIAVLLAGLAGSTCDARVHAEKGRTYKLTKQHGPWMLMVASFNSTAPDGETREGKTPQQAADELVYELRKQGLPAYTYTIEADQQRVPTRDRLGQPSVLKTIRKVKSTCVVAGNYPSFEDKLAQQSLEWVKKYDPKCLKEGVEFRPTPGRPLPLSAAFLTINPLLSAEEVASRSVDPLLKRLNSGLEHSLFENEGEYTLVVAYFAGKSFSQVREKRDVMEFLTDNDLDIAGQQANELVMALRQELDPRGRFNDIEAWVWHDRTHSVVTVGSFKSENDPAIAHYRRLFAATVDPQTNQMQVQYLTLAGAHPKTWAFVPTPQLMRVPKVR